MYKIRYNAPGGEMKQKPIDWRGSSLDDLKDDKLFTQNAPVINLAKYKRGLSRIIGSLLMKSVPVPKRLLLILTMDGSG